MRSAAHHIDRSIQAVADAYVRRVKSLGVRVRAEVLRAYIDGGDIAAAIRSGLAGLEVIIAAGMVAGHAEGYAQAQERAATRGAVPQRFKVYHFARGMRPTRPASIMDEAMRLAEKRAKLPAAKVRRLADRYSREAATATNQIGTQLERKVAKAVADGIRRNVHTRQGANLIRKAFDAAGVTPQSPATFEAVFRTQVSIAYNAARMIANERPEIQAILWGYRYNTVGDQRVRPAHRAMNGAAAPVNDPMWSIWTPPCGFQCRCVLIEIYKTDPAKQRRVKRPPATTKDENGKSVPVQPDPGFDFNPADVFREIA